MNIFFVVYYRSSEATARPRSMHVPKRVTTSKSDSSMYDKNYDNGTTSYNMTDSLSVAQPPAYNSLNNGGTSQHKANRVRFEWM